ncbi:MAG: hypothetical protein ACREC6_09375 [Hyphomicrobiaceae bacterium]
MPRNTYLLAAAMLAGSAGGLAAQDATETVEALRKSSGDRVVRVVVTVQGEAAEKAEVARALRAAGAASVQPIRGQPALVVEAKPQQLEAAVATGKVKQIHVDTPDPTN